MDDKKPFFLLGGVAVGLILLVIIVAVASGGSEDGGVDGIATGESSVPADLSGMDLVDPSSLDQASSNDLSNFALGVSKATGNDPVVVVKGEEPNEDLDEDDAKTTSTTARNSVTTKVTTAVTTKATTATTKRVTTTSKPTTTTLGISVEEQFVRRVYVGVADRQGDPVGIEHWTMEFESTKSTAGVLNDFLWGLDQEAGGNASVSEMIENLTGQKANAETVAAYESRGYTNAVLEIMNHDQVLSSFGHKKMPVVGE